MKDIAEQIALGIDGKSGRANAPENQNTDFKQGFNIGSELDVLVDSFVAIRQEWTRIGEPEVLPNSFKEWKRGFWAARMQRLVAAVS